MKHKLALGIPDQLRGELWPLLADLTGTQSRHPATVYRSLFFKQNKEYHGIVELDVRRTLNTNIFFESNKHIGKIQL